MSLRIRRFRITGRVQGVFFRDSTRFEAERLGIRGYAANLADGSVEVLACGAEAALETLREWLHRGPRAARVAAVIELDAPLEADPASGFEVR